MFVNEDISKVENRINLSIFHLLQQDWFKNWFFGKLKIQNDAVVYPNKNIDVGRPDLCIELNNEHIAYIEVECGAENPEQIARFKKNAKGLPVISIVGRKIFNGDLSLEEILEFAISNVTKQNLTGQKRISVEYLIKLISAGISGKTNKSLPSAPVSDFMLEKDFVKSLQKYLGDSLSFDITGRISPGTIRAETRKEKGLSIKVWSTQGAKKEISILFIIGNKKDDPDFVNFQSKEKMLFYLSEDCHPSLLDLVKFVKSLGGDMERIKRDGKTKVALCKLSTEENVKKLCSIILKLK